MFDTKEIDEVIENQLGDGPSKTASAKSGGQQQQGGGSNGQTKTAEELHKEAVKKEAKDSHARGQLMGKGFVDYVLKTAADLGKNAESTNMSEGGNVQEGGSKITEPGSVAEQANALPTNKDNPSKSKIDETKGVKHVREENLDHSPPRVEKSEARIEKAMH